MIYKKKKQTKYIESFRSQSSASSQYYSKNSNKNNKEISKSSSLYSEPSRNTPLGTSHPTKYNGLI